MAMHNFVEMRDHTASQLFLWKKKFQHLLHGLFPRAFIPLYNMVSFTTIPYAEAQRRAAWQANVLRIAAIGASALLLAIIAGAIAMRR
jgi:kynurenine 3-monooxygenase